ncbi:hypothetical protein LSH36_550g03036 [Paralvinella palmiformis]|uniref:Uncharacterized protein n=1 Tax=Paralvinella palmiformis TaxID=53620 RepID=A0AAD9J6P8_9ANNE|nr:hypothetical protein LSH36_550g03036 [Paralvinella palmiformis]
MYRSAIVYIADTMGRTEIDKLLAVLGNPGRYSRILFPLLCLNYIQVAFNHLAMSIYAATPPHVCRLPVGVPVDNRSIPTKGGVLDSCTLYANYTHTSGEAVKCTEWQYTLRGRVYHCK